MDLYSFHMCGSSKSDLIDCLKFLNLSIQSFKICNFADRQTSITMRRLPHGD